MSAPAKFDFSRAASVDIRTLVNRTKEALTKTPGSTNAPAWRDYIADGEAELKRRGMKLPLILGGIGVAAIAATMLGKRKGKSRRGRGRA